MPKSAYVSSKDYCDCAFNLHVPSNDGGKNYLSDSKSWGKLKGKEKEIVIESWHYV